GFGAFLDPRYRSGISTVNVPPLRIIGLDIEQSTFYRDGNFPLPHDPLLSIGIYTWDDRRIVGYCVGHSSGVYPSDEKIIEVRLEDSTALVKWAIDWILEERPDFIIVHNGYAYDIPTMAAHCPKPYEKFFKIVNLDRKNKGVDLQIAGVTLIDSYRYLDKLHRSEYESLSLDSLAQHVLHLSKVVQPPLNLSIGSDSEMQEVLYYNVYDSYLHLKVAEATGMIQEIISLTSVSRSPISDVTRYITGSMASTLVASFAFFDKHLLDWSPENVVLDKYRGGLVLEPLKGVHRKVMVFDVQSMYPTVMIDLNISPETVIVKQENRQRNTEVTWVTNPDESDVSWIFEDEVIKLNMDGFTTMVPTPQRKIGLVAKVLRSLIEKRKEVGKKTPAGLACKILANSMYGALGAKTGLLQCRYGAAMVTAGGRFVLHRAKMIAKSLGYDVVYGDTDSVFLTKDTNEGELEPELFLQSLYTNLESTPFQSIRLDLEETFKAILFLKPKMYYGVSTRGSEKVRGIATARKDRPPIVRSLVKLVCQILCYEESPDAYKLLSLVLYDAYTKVQSEEYTIREVAFEVRKAGIGYLSFKDVTGNYQMLRTDDRNFGEVLPSTEWVLERMSKACDSILEPSGYPNFRTLVSKAYTML
ncbi:DNA polymerase, partial [Ascosphaera aggregata]